MATFTLTYPPGAYSGWHSHPGIVVAVVKSGTVLRQVGCRKETFTVGDSFTEVGTHRVSNPETVDAVLEITQIYPSDAPARRIEQTDPCPVASHTLKSLSGHDGVRRRWLSLRVQLVHYFLRLGGFLLTGLQVRCSGPHFVVLQRGTVQFGHR